MPPRTSPRMNNTCTAGSAPPAHPPECGNTVGGAPRLSISDATALEGNAGTRALAFAVTLSAPSDAPVTITYATADGSATLADGDYRAASGSLTFAAGQTN